MVLYGLKPLFDEMKATGELRQQFIYTFNNITVDVLFLTDDKPFFWFSRSSAIHRPTSNSR